MRAPPTTTPSTMNFDDFTGLPTQGARPWTKESLAYFMENLITSGQKVSPFTSKIGARWKTSYQTEHDICNIYSKWKLSRVFWDKGHLPAMSVDAVRSATTQTLKIGLIVVTCSDYSTWRRWLSKRRRMWQQNNVLIQPQPSLLSQRCGLRLWWQ